MAEWWDGLTEKQRLFCEAYSASGGNATDAGRVAGYSAPHVEASKNLNKPKVVAALEKLRESTTISAIATREERQAFWTSTLRGEEPDSDMRDRLKASELLGRCQADFIERRELTGKNGGPVSYQLDLSKLSKAERDIIRGIISSRAK